MGERDKNTGTFIIKILGRQNSTWQGNVVWADEHKEQCFRSALELLKLIDGALDSNHDNHDGNYEIEGGSQDEK